MDVIVDLSDTYFGWQKCREKLGLDDASLDYSRLLSLVANSQQDRVIGISAAVRGKGKQIAQQRFHHSLRQMGWDIRIFSARKRAWPVEIAYLIGRNSPTYKKDPPMIVSSGSHLDSLQALLEAEQKLQFSFFMEGISDHLAREVLQETTAFVDLTPHVEALTLHANTS